MKKFIAATALIAMASAAIAAQAQTPPAPPASMHDKAMTRTEVQAMVRGHFARIDANKDSVITKEEIAAGHPMMVMNKGSMGDPTAAFDRLDANKDGMISRDEFAKGREIRIEKRIVMREGGPGADATPGAKHKMRMHRMGGGGMGGGMGGGRMIAMADTDKDGRITLAEVEAMALKHFDQMDANHDGQVTPDERRAARPMRMKMRMAPKAG